MRGSKRQLRPGVWELRVYRGKDPLTHKDRYQSKTVYGTARVADQELRKLCSQVRPAGHDDRVTFGQVLDLMIDECVRLHRSPTTITNYRAAIDRSIRPALGSMRLSKLDARVLDQLYGRFEESGMSAKTIRNHHGIISAALSLALRWDMVSENAAKKARPPSVPHGKISPPSPLQVQMLLGLAEKRDPSFATFLRLAALTGMRRGELCGLRWSDIDFGNRRITVCRSTVVAGGQVTTKTTKTNRERVVAIDDLGEHVLRLHRDRALGWASQAEIDLGVEAYVFSPVVDGSQPFRPDAITTRFISIRNNLGLRSVRLHDLRHFTAPSSSLVASTLEPSPGALATPTSKSP